MKKSETTMNNSNFGNRSLALKLLFSHGELSRTDIANYLNITSAAVTSIASDLLEEGLLVQKEEPLLEGHRRAGRRRAPLGINYDWKYVVAIDIHSYYTNIAITNLEGRVIVEKTNLTPTTTNLDAFFSSIAKDCIKMLWETSIPTEKILGAGVTIIGPVNQNEGIALHPFRLFEQQVPVKQYFEKEFPFPVAVESNVCAFLLSEMLYTDIAASSSNILMLKWGPGVGSAMAIRGQIYKGYGYQSTEIGHNQIAGKNGKKCNCGRTGCLEPSISSEAIIEFIQQEASKSIDNHLSRLVALIGAPSRQNLDKYLEEAPNCPELWDFLKSCARSLASLTNNAIHILAPDKLLLIGNLFEHDHIVTLFTHQLYEINPQLPSDLVSKNRISAGYSYMGAVAIAIEQLLFPL